ncbi:MAG: hypothetical protein HKN09_03585 [Saprospiraceae bacterium]|nr:hypothetical protein [Saprospiraceae bacterium]
MKTTNTISTIFSLLIIILISSCCIKKIDQFGDKYAQGIIYTAASPSYNCGLIKLFSSDGSGTVDHDMPGVIYSDPLNLHPQDTVTFQIKSIGGVAHAIDVTEVSRTVTLSPKNVFDNKLNNGFMSVHNSYLHASENLHDFGHVRGLTTENPMIRNGVTFYKARFEQTIVLSSGIDTTIVTPIYIKGIPAFWETEPYWILQDFVPTIEDTLIISDYSLTHEH